MLFSVLQADTEILLTCSSSQSTCTSQGDIMIEYPGVDNLFSVEGPGPGDTTDVGHFITSFYCLECTNCT